LLELFRRTTKYFLDGLDEERLQRVAADIRDWHVRKSHGWFGLGPSERRDKLDELVVWVKGLLDLFVDDREVADSEGYRLLARVFDDHCEVVPNKERSANRQRSRGSGKKGRRGKKGKGRGRTRSVWTKTEEIVLRNKGGSTVQSPHDPDAEYGHKGSGYSVQVTETCRNEAGTEIITDYEVHGNARSDRAKAPDIVERLETSGLKPETLYADAGYPTAESSLDLEEQGTDLFAPVHRGKMKAEVMGRDQFVFDDSGNVVRCPRGHAPKDNRVRNPNGEGAHLHAYFDGDLCRRCPDLERCPVRASNHREKGCSPRDSSGDFRLDISAALRRRDERLAAQATKEWKDRYKIRAGVEATMSELKRAHGMTKLRVRRRPRVTYAVACKIIACNIKRWIRAVSAAHENAPGPLVAFSASLSTFFSLWCFRRAETRRAHKGPGRSRCSLTAHHASHGLAAFTGTVEMAA
jgi:hypothetical protein